LGTVPLIASTVSQVGRLLVSTVKNGAGEELELTATVTEPGCPEPLV
jgi:hypothetical protein